MAEVFEKVGNWFMKLPLEDHKIDMCFGDQLCGSPTCVGGWLAKYYNTKMYGEQKKRVFYDGTNAFSEDLGFFKTKDDYIRKDNYILKRPMDYMKHFFSENKELWGNRDACYMFATTGEFAYDEGDKRYTWRNLTTKAVAEKYLAIAKRLREADQEKYVSLVSPITVTEEVYG